MVLDGLAQDQQTLRARWEIFGALQAVGHPSQLSPLWAVSDYCAWPRLLAGLQSTSVMDTEMSISYHFYIS